MPTTTSYWVDGELIEEETSSGEVISSVTHRDEIRLLAGKSKREIADLYMRGIISAEQFEDWCRGNDY